jgi:tRNA (guanine-N7-)-methyltransferase
LKNVAFIRTRIEIIDHFFAQDEVAELWITFCDPFPRPTKANKRLTSEYFNDKYRQVLRPGGLVHLKHDDDDLVRYTLGIIAADERCALLDKNLDIYAGELSMPEWAIQTLYEGKHLAAGKTIKYLRYRIS